MPGFVDFFGRLRSLRSDRQLVSAEEVYPESGGRRVFKEAVPLPDGNLRVIEVDEDGNETNRDSNVTGTTLGTVSSYPAAVTYSTTTNRLTLTAPGAPTTPPAGTGFYFQAPNNIDDADVDLEITFGPTNWRVYDIDVLRMSPALMIPGRIYEMRVFFLGGHRSFVILESIALGSGRYPRYTLITVKDPNDENDDSFWQLPTAAQFLNGPGNSLTRANPISWDATGVTLPMFLHGGRMFVTQAQIRLWFAVPFDDITVVEPAWGFSLISNYRTWFGTPDDPEEDQDLQTPSPRPLVISGDTFYVYGNILNLNPGPTRTNFNLNRE